MSVHRNGSTFRLLFTLGLWAASLSAQTYTYTTFTIPQAAPATNGSLAVNDINKSGVIVGSLVDTSGNLKGWQRSATGAVSVFAEPLDTTTPKSTGAYGLNNSNIIVGTFYDPGLNQYPGFVRKGRTYTTFTLGTEPALSVTYLTAINNKNAGYCGSLGTPPDYAYQPFLSLGGVTTMFSIPGSTFAICSSLTDGGAAAGYYTDAGSVQHGWIRNATTGDITVYNAPGAVAVAGTAACFSGLVGGTQLYGLNDSGEMAGHFWDASYKSHGFVVTPKGKFIQLDVPGAFQTGGGAVNAGGQVVGHYSDSACNNSGFIASH